MDEKTGLEPAHHAAGKRRPDTNPDASFAEYIAGPAVAGVDRGIMAIAVVEQIIRRISRVGDTFAVFIEVERRPDLIDNAAILLRSDPEYFSVR